MGSFRVALVGIHRNSANGATSLIVVQARSERRKPTLLRSVLAALPWRLTSIYGRVGGGAMPQRVRDGKNCRNVAASATTAIAPTVRKRPTAQVVSIDQAQRAGKYQRGAKPTDQPVGTNGQPPPWTSLRNRAASRQLTGNHQPGTRASRIRGELAPVVRLYRRQDHQVDRMDAEQCSEQEEHDPARRASRAGVVVVCGLRVHGAVLSPAGRPGWAIPERA